MKLINYLLLMPFYLKGVLKFRAKDYVAAHKYLKKAIEINKKDDNELLYQYYGQTLLCLNQFDESFFYLSKSYNLYSKKGWKVTNSEEYRLVKDTLDALKYLSDNFNLKVDHFNHDQEFRGHHT